jgi:hypothetical protein
MTVSDLVKTKIIEYRPKGFLAITARFFLALSKVRHSTVKGHLERLALTAEEVALELAKDAKAAFFAALLHDIGKLFLPPRLFDGRNITDEEYALVKTHAMIAFRILKHLHCFIAYCAGFHHAIYQAGYGLSIDDFPQNWSPATVKKVLEISQIVSVCDFIDAYRYRKTGIKDGSDVGVSDLRGMLVAKYPDDIRLVDIAIAKSRW